MAKVHGKDSVFSLEDSGGSTLRDLTTYIEDVTLNIEQDEAQLTCKGQTAETYVQAHTRSTIQISGKYDSTATTGPAVVLFGLYGDTGTCLFEFGPEGGTTNLDKYSGECFLTSYDISSPLADIVKFSATLRVSGAITKGVYT